MFDFSIVTSWVHGLLTSLMPVGLAVFLECVIVGVCLLLMYTVIAILMIFMERKVCAAFQCRLGPVRVGPWGTLQVICDVFKMLTKEIITIRRSDKFLYNLAPYIVILASVLAFSCLPFNKGMEILDFNGRVFFLHGRLVDRYRGHPAGRVELQQQVLAHRRHAKRCADDFAASFDRAFRS